MMSELMTHAARALPIAGEALSALSAFAGLVGMGGLIGLAAVFIAAGGHLDLTA